MYNLIKNEWIKSMMRPATYIMLILIVLAFVLNAALNHFSAPGSIDNKIYEDNWKKEVQTDINEYNSQLAELSKKDPDKISFKEAMKQTSIEQEIPRLQYYYDKNVQPPAARNFFSNILGTSPVINLVALMIIILAGSLMSREYQQGTIKLLMIRPASRLKIFFSKYLFAVIASIVFVVFTYGVSAIISAVTMPHNPTHQLAITDYETGALKMVDFWPFLMKIILNDLLFVIIFASIAYALSVIFRNTAAAQGIALGLLFLSSLIVAVVASKTELVKYIWPANWTLNRYLLGTPPVKEMTYQFSLGYNLIALIVIISIAAFIFNRRDIAN